MMLYEVSEQGNFSLEEVEEINRFHAMAAGLKLIRMLPTLTCKVGHAGLALASNFMSNWAWTNPRMEELRAKFPWLPK